MGISCKGGYYLYCLESDLCCKNNDTVRELQKRKLYQEFKDSSQHMLKKENTDYYSKKRQNLVTQPDLLDDLDESKSIVILGESHYYESNGELCCIEANKEIGDVHK